MRRLAASRSIVATLGLLGGLTVAVVPATSGATVSRHSGCSSAVVAGDEPSRQLPPGKSWLAGYTRSYCQDFIGSSLPHGWGKFSGVPSGDPSGYFDPSHVVVDQGMLSLNADRDPAIGGKWATGGVCQCGVGRTYGSYLVRSRLTGGGVDEVQMLWPVAHVWPPEVDFNETGQRSSNTAWYVHIDASGKQIAHTLKINLLAWHTWGVRWTTHLLTFTVDGKAWGSVRSPSVIPHEAMTLDLSQQTWCGLAPECPTRPVSMQIDWVAEYAHN